MAHDAGVGQKRLHLFFAEPRHLGGIETGKAAPECVALGQDGAPAQPGLETLQAELFEQRPVVGFGVAPFGIVISHVLGGRIHPAAAGESVGEFGLGVQFRLLGRNRVIDATPATSPKKDRAAEKNP
ncbi:hypothetical protein D9M68_764210 [compost metagenome]